MTRVPRKRAEALALGGVVLTLLGMTIMLVVSRVCNSMPAGLQAWHLLGATAIWFISYLHLRARRLADEERTAIEEAERTRAEMGRDRLFEGEEIQAAVAQARLRQMERYGAPIAGVLIALLLLAVAIPNLIGLYSYFVLDSAEDVTQGIYDLGQGALARAKLAAVLSFLVAFPCFVLGKYASGLARTHKHFELLRAGAGYTIGCAFISFFLTISYAFAYTGALLGETILAWAIPVVLVAIALEMLVSLVLGFYRPRAPGELSRPIYDSRLTGLLAEPQGLFRTFAHTLDYQFGFKVSETWFFRFLNKAIAPLILFQLAALYALTCVVVVDPGDVAVVERWGRPRGVSILPPVDDAAAWDALEPPLEPGFHVKWPWPVEIVRRVPRDQVQEILVGAPQEQYTPEAIAKRGDVVGWAEEHIEKEYKYLMPLAEEARLEGKTRQLIRQEDQQETPDAMFVSGAIAVQYSVGRRGEDGGPRSADVYRYLYRHQDPESLMITLTERKITSFMAGANFWDVLVEETRETEERLQRRIQDAADRVGLGVRILFVSLSNIHPPVGDVGKAYQDVVGARQQREARILEGQTVAVEIMELADGEAAQLLNSAEGYYAKRVLVSGATAQRFADQQKAYAAAPRVYLHRERLRTIEEGLKDARLLVVPPEVQAVIDDKQDITEGIVTRALAQEVEREM